MKRLGNRNRKMSLLLIIQLVLLQLAGGVVWSVDQANGYGYNEGIFFEVIVEEPLLYTTRGEVFYVLNVSDLQPLEVEGEFTLQASYNLLFAKQDDLVFVASDDTIELLNIENPANPLFVGDLSAPNIGYLLSDLYSLGFINVAGQSYLFVQTNTGLTCLNYTLPSNPMLVAYPSFPGEAGRSHCSLSEIQS